MQSYTVPSFRSKAKLVSCSSRHMPLILTERLASTVKRFREKAKLGTSSSHKPLILASRLTSIVVPRGTQQVSGKKKHACVVHAHTYGTCTYTDPTGRQTHTRRTRVYVLNLLFAYTTYIPANRQTHPHTQKTHTYKHNESTTSPLPLYTIKKRDTNTARTRRLHKEHNNGAV